MRKLIVLLILLVTTVSFAQPHNLAVEITEGDGSPSTYPYKIKFSDTTVTDNADGTTSVDTTGTATTGWTDDGTVVRLTTITDDVGIGTTAPSGKLEVVGTGDSSFDTDTLFIDSSENSVGIGTSTPSAKLEVSGDGDTNFDGDTLFIDSSADRVGVGTSTPTGTFSVSTTFIVESGGTITFQGTNQGSNPGIDICVGADKTLCVCGSCN